MIAFNVVPSGGSIEVMHKDNILNYTINNFTYPAERDGVLALPKLAAEIWRLRSTFCRRRIDRLICRALWTRCWSFII